jgi:hypothetical protein
LVRPQDLRDEPFSSPFENRFPLHPPKVRAQTVAEETSLAPRESVKDTKMIEKGSSPTEMKSFITVGFFFQ